MDSQISNHWSPFEYDKLKLLLNRDKVDSIMKVMRQEKPFDETAPISVELHLTDNCNLKCPWCTDSALRQNMASLSREVVIQVLDYFAKQHVGVTVEGGGEPTIHPNFSELIDYAYEQGVHMGLITNGVQDISSDIQKFKWVRVSLDASCAEEYKVEKGKDKFEIVLQNLQKFSQSRDPKHTHLGVGYVLTTRNISGIGNILSILDQIGVDYIYIRPVEEAPEITPSLKQLLELKEKIVHFSNQNRLKGLLTINERLIKDNDKLPCVAHSLTCIIQANGDMAMCEKRRHDPVVFGNLNNDDFRTIWNCNTRIDASRKLLNPVSQQGCATCRITSFNRIVKDLDRINTKEFI